MYQNYPKVGSVIVEDKFWTPYLNNVRYVMLPYVFRKFEEEGYVANYLSVTKKDGAKHNGPYFSDGLFLESLRGACDFLAAERDPLLEAYIDKAIKILAEAAGEDGYLCTGTTQRRPPEQRWGDNNGDIIAQHDLYNHGCLVEAAVSHYNATGKTTMLCTAVNAANLICSLIGKAPKKNIIPGHSLSEEAFVKLYCLFRDTPALEEFAREYHVNPQDYLDIAEFWYDARGDHRERFLSKEFTPPYSQDHVTFSKQTEAVGHSVRAMLCYLGATVVAKEKNREDFFKVLPLLWDSVVYKKLHISGGIGARHDIEGFDVDYNLPNKAYLETCAAIGLAFWNTEMNTVTLDSKYFDCFERSLYNNILSSVGADFRHFFYQNPLESDGSLRRWDWHGCPCCPPMQLKLFSALNSFIYSYNEEEKCVNVNMFIGSSYENDLFAIRQSEGQLAVDSKGEKLTVRIRIPEYVKDFALTRNGVPMEYTVQNGYAVMEDVWSAEEPVKVSYENMLRRIYANPKVQEDNGKVAVMYGPYVMCAEGIDNEGDVDITIAEDPELTVSGENVYGKAASGKEFCLIPYYKWCNRGEGANDAKMTVWMNQENMRSMEELAAGIGDKLYDTYA